MWRVGNSSPNIAGHHVTANNLLRAFSSSAPTQILTRSQSESALQDTQILIISARRHRHRALRSRWHDSTISTTNDYRVSFSTINVSRSWWKGSDKPAESTTLQSFAFEQLKLPDETKEDIEHLPTRRVHILGLGSIGTLVAHSLRCLPNPPPITLLMHKPEMYESFKGNGKVVRLVNPRTDVNDEQTGFDADVQRIHEDTGVRYWEHNPHYTQSEVTSPLEPGETLESGEVFIYTLILTVKGPRTMHALQSVKHRLNAQSTVLLLQNGMGQVEQLNREVFTDPATRPTYMIGIISHGAHMAGPFAVNHAGTGTVALGIYRDPDKYPLPPKSSDLNVSQLSPDDRKRMYPTDEELYSNLSSRYLLRTMTRSPVLVCAPYPYLSIFQLQLEKLVQNCAVNPITALLNIPNGSMLGNPSITRSLRLMLAEISLVIRGLPELEGIPGVRARFAVDRLESLWQDICTRTAANSSSMREDVHHLKPTEIDYINGYIVRRGEEQGIKCVLNYLVMKLVQGKTAASGADEIKPYNISLVRREPRSSSDTYADGRVTLEDTGTQLKGKAY